MDRVTRGIFEDFGHERQCQWCRDWCEKEARSQIDDNASGPTITAPDIRHHAARSLKRMALRLLQPFNSSALRRMTARYHDYVRVATPGEHPYPSSHRHSFTYMYPTGGILRVPLASPKVIGVANSRGNRR